MKYYVNQATNESSWHPPTLHATVEATATVTTSTPKFHTPHSRLPDGASGTANKFNFISQGSEVETESQIKARNDAEREKSYSMVDKHASELGLGGGLPGGVPGVVQVPNVRGAANAKQPAGNVNVSPPQDSASVRGAANTANDLPPRPPRGPAGVEGAANGSAPPPAGATTLPSTGSVKSATLRKNAGHGKIRAVSSNAPVVETVSGSSSVESMSSRRRKSNRSTRGQPAAKLG